VLLGGVGLVACSPASKNEPTSTDLAAMAESNVEAALRGAHRAGSFLADSAALADALSPLAGSSEQCDYSCDANGNCSDTCVTQTQTVTVADLQDDRDSLNQSIDDLVKELKEKIFTTDNLESESDGTATYLLGPKTFCVVTTTSSTSAPPPVGGAGTSSTAQPPMTQSSIDPDCAKQINSLQPRLRLSSPSAGNVDVALLLTSSKYNPVTLELYTDHAGIVVDLGDLKKTLDAAGEDTGSLASMVGKVGFEVKKNAELDYSLQLNVLEDVVVGVRAATGEIADVGLGKSVPTLELRLDGNTKKLTGTMDYGAITAQGPLNAFRDTFDPETYDAFGNPVPRPTYVGAVDGLLAGIEASVTLDGNADRLTLQHLGLGDQTSRLKVDSDVIAAVDLNPQAQRHFDLTLAKDPGGTIFTFSPTLDATVLLNFAPLAKQISDIAPELMNDTLHFWFDGQNPSLQKHGDDQVKVLTGTLNYTSSYDPTQNVTAAAGSCISSPSDTTSSSSNTPALVVGACK
jgi:hypothetical protein